jgi:hypothetical protein
MAEEKTFIKIPREDIFYSPAYRKLSPKGQGGSILFLNQVRKNEETDPEYYKTVFSLSYAEAKEWNFGKSAFGSLCRELEKAGFIERVWKGGMKMKERKGEVSLFRLSPKWKSGPNAEQNPEITDAENEEWRPIIRGLSSPETYDVAA